jgi:hypothetical protein
VAVEWLLHFLEYIVDSLSHTVSRATVLTGVKKESQEVFTPDYGDPGWFQGSDMGHHEWVCHPPHPLTQDDFVNRADWMRAVKDRESPEKLPVPEWKR